MCGHRVVSTEEGRDQGALRPCDKVALREKVTEDLTRELTPQTRRPPHVDRRALAKALREGACEALNGDSPGWSVASKEKGARGV